MGEPIKENRIMLAELVKWTEIKDNDVVLFQGHLAKVLDEPYNYSNDDRVRMLHMKFLDDDGADVTAAVFKHWWTARLGENDTETLKSWVLGRGGIVAGYGDKDNEIQATGDLPPQ